MAAVLDLPAVTRADAFFDVEVLHRHLDALVAERDGLQTFDDIASWQQGAMRGIIRSGLDRLPMPGSGATLRRWQVLAAVGAADLALVKLYESHTDALAILSEIDPRRPTPGRSFAVWAAEGGRTPLRLDPSATIVTGTKPWCSGSSVVDAGLVTCATADGRRQLVELSLDARGVTVDRTRWNAVGMRDSGSFDLVCEGAEVRLVGSPDAYLQRPGFWHGGIGVAACWYGAASAIGARVRELQQGREDVHALAHLGAIDASLAAAGALLRECAADIDRAPHADASHAALRVRGFVADVAETVIHHAGRAVGPGPLCNEPALARRIADLPIFIRQCGAEHDRVAQARALLAGSCTGWPL